MSTLDKDFVGSIPEFYDTYLVPLIFQPYANDLAQRIANCAPGSILETAAGSGVLPRALARLLDPETRYIATDLNQPMLDHAAQKQGAGGPVVEFAAADALDLQFADQSFDIVTCQFGVMFFPDRARGYREAKRVLKPHGQFIFNVWDRIEENVFADIVTQAAAELFPSDPPRFLPRTPHGYHDVESITQDLREAGFDYVSIETIEDISSAPSARHPAVAYCQGTPLRNEIEARNPDRLEDVTRLATDRIAARFGHGQVEAKIRGHVITAK